MPTSMDPSQVLLLRVFYLTSVAVVSVVSLWLSRRYRHLFFENWAKAYLFILAASLVDTWTASRAQTSLGFLLGATGVLGAAFFFARVGFEIRGRRAPSALPLVATALLALSIGLRLRYSFDVGIAVPALAFTASLFWLAGVLLVEPGFRGRYVARILAGLILAKGLWAFAFPLLVNSGVEWTGYWLDGVFHLLIGMAMLVFVLERSAEETRLLVESNARHAFFLANPRGEITSWNSGARRLHGFAELEVVGKPLSSLLEDEGAGARLLGELEQAAAGCAEHEGWHRREDGTRFWARMAVSAIRDPRQNPRGLAVLVNDLSERRALEQERARLTAAVRQSVEGIVITDREGRVEYVNPAFERSRGLGAAEVLGRPLQSIGIGGEVDGLAEAIAGRRDWYGRLVRGGERDRVVEDLVLSPAHDVTGAVQLFVLRIHDVSRETALQEQVQQARKMEEVGRLSGGIAHEFGNLLAIIVSYNHLLKGAAQSDETVRKSVEAIGRATNRADRLIGQLLAFCRHDEMARQAVELNAFVSQFVGMVRRVVREDLEIHTSLEPAVGRVLVDPEQLEQALMNLVLNARDAIPGPGTIRLETRALTLAGGEPGWSPAPAAGPHAELVVGDSGSGISAEVRGRIFEPFFTTKPVGKGTGIGLSVVDAFVREARGSMQVESGPGQGTTFRILFPAAPEPEARTGGSAARAPLTVLVVDDEPLLGQAVCQILEALELRTLRAASAAEALELSRSHPGAVDLLLTDVTMPGMSGKTLSELLRGVYPGMKTLFMSGHLDDPEVRRARESAAGFLAKPFGPEALLREVRELLGLPPRTASARLDDGGRSSSSAA